MLGFFRQLGRDRRGTAPLEYALVAVLIAVAIVSGVRSLGSNMSKVFSTVASTI